MHSRLPKIRLFMYAVVISLLLASPLSAQERRRGDLSGIWEGQIDVKGTILGIVVEFKQGERVEWTGDIDIDVQGAKDIPLDNILVDAGGVRFEMPNVPGDPFFEGSLSSDGRVIVGDFTQGGAVFPFSMALKDSSVLAAEASELRLKLEKLRQFIDTVRTVWKVPGISVAIIHHDKVVMSEGFGYRNLEDSLPATRTTMYPIGSATKSFTAAGLALLVDRGQVDWDEPVRTYLPGFRLYDSWASERITVRDLLTHRSGLPRHDAMWYNSDATREELVRRLAFLEPNIDFRSGFQYQNMMYVAAGYLIEKVSGETWETYTKKNLFVPIGLARSNFSIDILEKSPDHALPYREADDGIRLIPYRAVSNVGPAGSINAGAVDMARWMRFHLRRGLVGVDTQLLSESLMEEMHQPAVVVDGEAEPERLMQCYGLGWFVEAYRGIRRVYHGGNIDGFSALLSLYPDNDLGIVALANLDDTPLPEIITHYAADLFLGLSPVDFHGRLRLQLAGAEMVLDQAQDLGPDVDRHQGTKPSHKLREYAGTYASPGYGELVVSSPDEKKLRVTFNNMSGDLEHYHYDIFRSEFAEAPHLKLLFTFTTGLSGDVEQVRVPLEPMVGDIVFERRPPPELSEPDSLIKYTGLYSLSGQTIRFELKGDVLVGILPGQPTYELKPYRRHEFRIADLNGYAVEFLANKAGLIEQVLFKQPNGTFKADRLQPLDDDGND
ncbi:MAG: serine hydrolase [bacterium]